MDVFQRFQNFVLHVQNCRKHKESEEYERNENNSFHIYMGNIVNLPQRQQILPAAKAPCVQSPFFGIEPAQAGRDFGYMAKDF